MTIEDKIEAPKLSMFKGDSDTQEVEKFLWYLENYFKHGNVRDDEAKINTASLYLMVADAERGLCTSMWDQFKAKIKCHFIPNNISYDARHKFRKLKNTRSIHNYVNEYTAFILQIPNLTSEELLSHFMDRLQNRAKEELQSRRVTDVDQAIIEVEFLINFRNKKDDKFRVNESKQ